MIKSIFTKSYKSFIDLLVNERKNAGITQIALAKKLNKPQSFVSKYENADYRLDIIEAIMIADALSIDIIPIIQKVQKSMNS